MLLFDAMALGGAIDDEERWGKSFYCLLDPSASQRVNEISVNLVCTSALAT